MTVRSMTGFGAASKEAAGLTVRVEVRTVNHRSLAVSVRGPSVLDALAAEVEAAVRRRIQRGSVNVSVSLARTRAAAPQRIAPAVLADYARQARDAAKDLGLAEPTLGDLLRLPGVLEEPETPDLGDDGRAGLLAAVDAAVADAVLMREREGAALAGELRGLLDAIERAAAAIEALVPRAVEVARTRLRERLAEILTPGQGVPEEVVAREIAVLADRTDVAEEVARLRSHVLQAREALSAGEAVGRRLDFLAQEFGREVNTVGSKSQDAAIAALVVEAKLSVERLKEQAANLE